MQGSMRSPSAGFKHFLGQFPWLLDGNYWAPVHAEPKGILANEMINP